MATAASTSTENASSTASEATIGWKKEAAWASGSIVTATITNAMALFALFFLTSVLGISPAVAGALIFISKLYDAVTDPVMGGISDRWTSANGRRRPFLAPGAVLAGATFALFFNLPALGGAMGIVVVGLALIAISTAYTIYSVPYLAMPPDIAPTYDARTRLMSFRVFFMMIGVLVGSAGAPLLVDLGSEPQDGFRILGISLGALIVIFGLIAYRGTKGLEHPVPTGKSASPFADLKSLVLGSFSNMVAVFGNAPFALLTIVKLLQLSSLYVVLACTPYFFGLVLQQGAVSISSYLMTFSFAGMLAIPLLRFIVKKLGKKRAYLVFLTIYSLAVGSWFLWTPEESSTLFFGRAILIGASSTGTLICTLSLLPDTMEYDRLISGASREGVMSGVFTLVEKLSGAVGPLIVGVLLQAMGLVVSGEPTVQQPESALFAVKLGVSIVPMVLTAVCVPAMLFYKLDETSLQAARMRASDDNQRG